MRLGPFAWLLSFALTLQPSIADARSAADYNQLVSCIKKGQTTKFKVLLKERLPENISLANRSLLIAAAIDQAQPSAIDALLDWGIGANQLLLFAQNGGILEITPLMYAISAKAGLATVARLVAHGADVNKASEALFPLNFALSMRQYDVADFLLDHGAQANRADDLTGMPPFMELAISAQDTDGEVLEKLTKKLVSSGADINARARRKATALHFAVLNGSVAMTRILLEAGADPNIRNNKGESVLAIALHGHRNDLINILKQFGAQP